MAPNFLQKFVKSATPNSNSNNSPNPSPRERVSSDVYSSLRSPVSPTPSESLTSSSGGGRGRAATTSNGSSSSITSPTTPTQASIIFNGKSPSRRSSTNNSTGEKEKERESRIPSIITTLSGRNRSKSNNKDKEKEKEKSDKEKKKSLEAAAAAEKKNSNLSVQQTNQHQPHAGDRSSWGSAYSSQPNFTIVPPSPLVRNGDLYSSDSNHSDNDNSDGDDDEEHRQQHQREPNTNTADADRETDVATPTLPKTFSASIGQDSHQGAASKNNTGSVITSSSTSTANNATSTTTNTTTPRNTNNNNNDTEMSTLNLAPGSYQVRKKPSNKSIKKGGAVPPEINVAAAVANLGGNNNSNGNENGNGSHVRAATAPAETNGHGEVVNGEVTMRPIVESPTDLKFPASSSSSTGAAGTNANGISTSNSNSTSMSPSTSNSTSTSNPNSTLGAPQNGGASLQRENTTSSILSPDPTGTKSKRPWRRSTTRKPTGLASAIAASGLAMANPSLSAAHNAQLPQVPVPPPALSAGSSKDRDPYMSRSPAQSAVSTNGGKGRHGKSRSGEVSPRSSKSRKSSVGSPPRAGGRPRRASSAKSADGATEFGTLHPSSSNTNTNGMQDDGSSLHRRPSYYTGLDGSSSGSDDDDSDSASGDSSDLDMDIGEEDIPVTGFAVASNKRNADFHELFPGVPEGDYLIEDYGCALQREILIQGRIYISENHICFHANIFGWITDLSIPIYEITSLEKKMTAFVIPNAIQITTRQAKYTFASFLSRDTTFDVIFNIWRLARPEDNVSFLSSGRGSMEGAVGAPGGGSVGAGGGAAGAGKGAINGAVIAGGAPAVPPVAAPQRKATQCTCGKENKHYSETAMDVTLPGTPEKINSLMFTSGFIKDFMVGNQKLLDIQMSDWAPVTPGSKLLTRNFSYIKPLNGSLGPKQTKCELKDEMVFCDFDQYVSTVTTTRTPDVPSGGVFSVKTRTCVTWAGPISTRVLVTTQVEWTGRSFIKGIIERSAIDGQKVYHAELEKCIRAYIQEHKSEFLPEGVDASIALVAPAEAAPGAPAVTEVAAEVASEKHPTSEELKQRERERNARGLQWAWDTFDGAWQVAGRSTKGALELIRDAWDQSTSTTILWFVIVVLVLSNIWTLMRMGSGRAKADRKFEARKVEDREKWVQSIVTALWDELNDKAAASGKAMMPGQVVLSPPSQQSQGQAVVQQPAVVVNEPADQVPLLPSPSVTILPYPQDDLETRNVKKAHLALEVQQLYQSLEALEQRVKTIKETLTNDLMVDTLD